MRDNDHVMEKALEAIRKGEPFYVLPYKEPKVWGAGGIGEYWFGAEPGAKSSTAKVGGDLVPMDRLLSSSLDAILGQGVVKRFGARMPLVKILTPNGRLSVQFHDAKNELWIVTATTVKDPSIILGFSKAAVDKYGKRVADEYGRALENYGKSLNTLIDALEKNGYKADLEKEKDAEAAAKRVGTENAAVSAALKNYESSEKEIKAFYNFRPVKVGDVIPIPSGTMHALGAGVEIVEPQIAGPTQSLEDGATYPVRYYFPGFERPGAQKKLDIDRVGEMEKEVSREGKPVIVKSENGYMVERLPGGFEDKGLEVHRITIQAGASLDVPSLGSFHDLAALSGKARVIVKGKGYDIPKASAFGEMLVVPYASGGYKIEALTDVQLVDTFTPVRE